MLISKSVGKDMRRARTIATLALTIVGFILGFFWSAIVPFVQPLLAAAAAFENAVVSFVQPFFEGLGKLRDSAETFLGAHPMEAGLLFALIGAVILPIFVGIIKLCKYIFRRRSIIDIIFANEQSIHLVTSHMIQTSFQRIRDGHPVSLPKNAPFLPSNIAIGVTLIYSYAHRRYGDKKEVLLHFDDENWGGDEHAFISIGGPFVNKFVQMVVDDKHIPKFDISDNMPTARDESNSYQAVRNAPNQPDASIVTDYGFLIYMKNPRNPNTRVCLAFGLWPQGTQAAINVLLNPGGRYGLVKQFYNAIRRDTNVIGIVRVNVKGLILDRPQLVKVREF
jgi:hypothetical protein